MAVESTDDTLEKSTTRARHCFRAGAVATCPSSSRSRSCAVRACAHTAAHASANAHDVHARGATYFQHARVRKEERGHELEDACDAARHPHDIMPPDLLVDDSACSVWRPARVTPTRTQVGPPNTHTAAHPSRGQALRFAGAYSAR